MIVTNEFDFETAGSTTIDTSGSNPPVTQVEQPTTPPSTLEDEILKHFGGERYDRSGNVIKDNKIVKSAEDVEAYKKTKSIEEVDNKESEKEEEEEVKYSIDDKGNLVDQAGKIIKNKGEFEVNEKGEVSFTDSFTKSLIELAKTKGFNFEDEDGNPVEFEDSEQGYFSLAEHMGVQIGQAMLEETLEEYKEVASLLNHLKAGGNAREYYQSQVSTTDYSKVILDTEVAQRAIVIEKLMRMNSISEEEAVEMADLMKANGSLEIKAKAAKEDLIKWTTSNLEAEEKRVQAAILAQKEAQIEIRKKVKDIVTSGILDNVEIPTKERNGFYEFLTQEQKGGGTAATKKYEELSLDKRLLLEYLLYKDLNVDNLVKIKAQQIQADLIKNRKMSKPIIITPSKIKGASSLPRFDEIN